MKVVEHYVLKKFPNVRLPIDIRIFDENQRFFTLDQDYLDDYDPFADLKPNITTVEPFGSSKKTVFLEIILPGKVSW